MTVEVTAGSKATIGHRRTARAIRDLLADELPRVRASALAWRNGLGALLAGLIGFGLVKGRSDVTQLQAGAAVIVGVLLLAALVAGSVAAVLLMRAAHGRPGAVSVHEVLDRTANDPGEGGRLAEAKASADALRRGVVLSFTCTALLCAALGLTWYGPAKDGPRIEVRLGDGSVACGEVVSLGSGTLLLTTDQGQLAVDLVTAIGLGSVDSCAPAVR